MALHHYQSVQRLPVHLEEAWEFFTDPRNLARITPPDMGFEITSMPSGQAYAGLMIAYRVRPLFGLPLQWVTEITHVVEGSMFIDEQRVGPYRVWHHQHAFQEVEGGTEMRDDLSYMLPFGIAGELAHPLVRRRIEAIFDHRARILDRMFRGEDGRDDAGADAAESAVSRSAFSAPARMLRSLRGISPRGA